MLQSKHAKFLLYKHFIININYFIKHYSQLKNSQFNFFNFFFPTKLHIHKFKGSHIFCISYVWQGKKITKKVSKLCE